MTRDNMSESARRVMNVGCLAVAACCLLGLGGPVGADELLTDNETRKLCHRFLDEVVAERIGQGLRIVRPYVPLSEEAFGKFREDRMNALAELSDNLGKPLRYEFKRKDGIKELYSNYHFIEQFEHGVVRWAFTFYKRDEGAGWVLQNVTADDRVSVLFRVLEEAE